jgi:hypothetical protein
MPGFSVVMIRKLVKQGKRIYENSFFFLLLESWMAGGRSMVEDGKFISDQ